MTIESLPARPLKAGELRSLERVVQHTAPVVIDVDSDGSDIHGAILVQDHQVTAIVLEPDGWEVLEKRDRPTGPADLERELCSWSIERPGLVYL